MSKVDYKSAGVDVHRGYEAVQRMKAHVEKTYIPGVLGGVGGFGGMFELPQGYEQPVLVSGTDGVGTKLQIAFLMDRHDTVGIDCVAMCVNDIVCNGAKPLIFLDYIGTGILSPAQVADIVKGVSEGCIQAGCALVGGESAEMPGFYQEGEYDLAGFTVGLVEKSKMITGENIQAGDVLIGIASSGIHSNGYSLVRKLCFEVQGLKIDSYVEELGKTLGEELITPTKIYVKTVLNLLEKFEVNGIGHITGGGWIENIPRILPRHLKAQVTRANHPVPKIFQLLQDWGSLEDADMYNTFNMGIGLVLAVPKEQAAQILAEIGKTDRAYEIGKIVERKGSADKEIEFV